MTMHLCLELKVLFQINVIVELTSWCLYRNVYNLDDKLHAYVEDVAQTPRVINPQGVYK